jgi:hypothetical protein
MSDKLNPELEKFLKEKCKPKQFVQITMMVTVDVYEDFIKYLNNFKSEFALVNRDSGKATLLGGKSKFNVIEGEKDDSVDD